MPVSKSAPKFLNLFQIKLPVGGIASIGHRASGVLMFAATPLLAWLLALSLRSADDFARVQSWLHSPVVTALSVVLVWSLSHHLLAGVRHLLLDLEVGTSLRAARGSAWTVNIGALLMTGWYLAVRL